MSPPPDAAGLPLVAAARPRPPRPEPAHAGHDEESGLREMARANRTRLLVAAVFGTVVMLVELAGGLYAHSLVLLADAGHYLTDVLAIGIALAAVGLTLRPASARRSYGYRRAEVLAALANAALLWGISLYFIWEAIARLRQPPPVSGPVVAGVGAFSLASNVVLAALLRRGSARSLNVRAAYLHILGDVLGSAAAVAAGLLVVWRGLDVADPILTLFVTLLIVVVSWRLTKQSLHILLEATPMHLDAEEIAEALRGIAPVRDVHELHVWSISSGQDAMSVHVVLSEPPRDDRVVHDIHHEMRRRFRLDHVTVQVESPGCPCESQAC